MKSTKKDLNDAYFATRFAFDDRRDIVWKEVCRYLQKTWIPENSRVLELGAGYCNFINNIRGSEKHAVDIFRGFSQYANQDVIAHTQDCKSMELFSDDSFDVIFASNLLEHLNRDEAVEVLSESRRILKPRGKLILLQPNFRYCYKTYFDDFTHLQVFTDRSLQDFLAATSFTVVDSKPRFLPVNMKTTLKFPVPGLPLFVRYYLRLPYKPFAGQMLMVAEKRSLDHE